MRACTNYDPVVDRLIPCKKAGLPFREGDVLDVVDMTDDNWWQVMNNFSQFCRKISDSYFIKPFVVIVIFTVECISKNII